MFMLNKASLDVASHASASNMRPVLNALYVRSDRVVATDSYRLLEVMHPEVDSAEYPIVKGLDASTGSNEGLLPLPALKKAGGNIPKSHALPILENVAVSMPEEVENVCPPARSSAACHACA